jgi:hypothetical protein
MMRLWRDATLTRVRKQGPECSMSLAYPLRHAYCSSLARCAGAQEKPLVRVLGRIER